VNAGVVLTSLLTCPHCGHAASMAMPEDACVWFFDCPGCGRVLEPAPGDCCVFCSHGSHPCPPRQRGARCCGPVATAPL
jgi:hypothetical protein